MTSEEEMRQLKCELRNLEARHNSLLRFVSNINRKINQLVKEDKPATYSAPSEISNVSIVDLTPSPPTFIPAEVSIRPSIEKAVSSSQSRILVCKGNKRKETNKSQKRRKRIRRVRPMRKQLMRELKEMEPQVFLKVDIVMDKGLRDLKDEEKRLELELSSLSKKIDALISHREVLQSQYDQIKNRIALAALASAEKSDLFAEYSTQRVFPWTSELERIRRNVFRISEFRPLQLQAINAYLSNRDVILVMPTGAGKSLVYQLPSFLETPDYANQFTLVVSPLVSLMNDQAIGLRRLGIPESSVALLDASSSQAEVQKVLSDISGDNVAKSFQHRLRLLFVTPEKLSKSKRLMHRLEKAYVRDRLARIAVDEVHCVSQWGHDFRPDYKFLHVLRAQFPRVPILGLTATASAEVVLDVQRMLGLKQHSCLVLRSSYNRPNLRYEVQFHSGPVTSSYAAICGLLRSEFSGQSGIIYCLSQKDTENLSAFLNQEGISAAFYHANVDPARRLQDHVAWLDGKIQVIVATVAFGMGIDKQDVRFVLHLSPSKSLENYYQESGRAGRDGAPSRVVLFWHLADFFRLANMVFAEQSGLPKLFQMIAYAVETRRCRRCLLSESLGDTSWEPFHCESSPCDICTHLSAPQRGADESTAVGREVDAFDFIVRMQKILEANRQKSQRLTGPKLVDLLVKDAGVVDALSQILPARASRKQQIRVCEFLLAWCLCNKVVTLDFHFTPYSTIVYVVGTSTDFQSPSKLFLPLDLLDHEETPKQSRKRSNPNKSDLDSD